MDHNPPLMPDTTQSHERLVTFVPDQVVAVRQRVDTIDGAPPIAADWQDERKLGLMADERTKSISPPTIKTQR
jgi:hypothetical protein